MKVFTVLSALPAVALLAACNGSQPSAASGPARRTAAAHHRHHVAGSGTGAEVGGISVTLRDCKVSVQPVDTGTAKVFSTQATVVNHNSTPTFDAPDFMISFGVGGSLGSITYQLEIPQPPGKMPASESHLAAWYGEEPGVNIALNSQPDGPVPCSVAVAPAPSGG
jgi:hypothetical protein